MLFSVKFSFFFFFRDSLILIAKRSACLSGIIYTNSFTKQFLSFFVVHENDKELVVSLQATDRRIPGITD